MSFDTSSRHSRGGQFVVSAAFVFILNLASFISSARAVGYWQQHVSYEISATLIDSIHTIDGNLTVAYANNSPDTLREVYFHLYANAFQPGSMMDVRMRTLHTNPVQDRISKLPESERGVYAIKSITSEGVPADFEVTGTIMRVSLPKPLPSGGSIRITIPFREQIPRQCRRSGWMSREGVEYSMSQWYPKIAEYDAEGWHRQEYISHEFYGVWGDFTVDLTLPSRFTVGATGQCMNPLQVGHGYDQIAKGEKDGIFHAGDEGAPKQTIWRFHASNVHDFAWVADDDYIHEWTTWKDTITLHAFYKTRYAPWWTKKALDYTQQSLAIYGEVYGPYAYRDFSTTMAGDGGMEYPELIMITGYRPSVLSMAGVIAHEVGHQWFYGMLGSNETREAFMDEGFTSYATTVAMNRMFGDHQDVPGQERSWLDWFIPQFSNKRDNYRGYQQIAVQQYEEPLDIPHDWLREDATGGQVYGKTQAILSMLEYALGNETFANGMKEYYTEWHFKHPHLFDFKKVMEKIAHTDLDWFFDEWFRSTRTVDYEAKDVTSISEGDIYETTLRLHNNDLAVMPIDLLLHYDDGSTASATIPISTNKDLAYFKPGQSVYFPGWDWVKPDYTAMTRTPKRVSWFEIDTSWRLQDLNWANNYSARSGLWSPPGEWAVWKQLFVNPPIDEYYSVVRPILWYSELTKMQAGAGMKFGMNNGYSGDLKLIYNADPKAGNADWSNHVDGRLLYSTPVDWLGRLTSFGFDASKLDGIGTANISISKMFRPTYWRLGADYSAKFYLESQRLLDNNYPFYHPFWDAGEVDVAGLKYSIVTERDAETFDVLGETSLWNSDAKFARAKAEYTNNFSALWNLDAKLRLTAGTATNGTPYQRQFWIDRASNYDEQSSPFFRAISGMNSSIGNQSGMFVEGGAGVRGYSKNDTNTSTSNALSGTQMIGANFDMEIPNPLASLGRFASSFNLGLFADAGWVGSNVSDFWSDFRDNARTDAGLKIGVNILSWLPSQLRGVAGEYAPIPEVNIYFPLYENHPVDGKNPIDFRWTVSVGARF